MPRCISMRRFAVFGSELGLLPDFSRLERAYVRCFGSLSRPTVQRYLAFKYFPLKFLRDQNITPEKILDFGCAYGGFGFMLARQMRLANVFLHDTDSKAESRCKYMIRTGRYRNVQFLTREQLERERGFSLTILTDVLEHIEDDYAAVKTIYDRTVKGGYLYLSVPHYRDESLSESELYFGHVRSGYTLQQIRRLLESVGFRIILRPRCRTTIPGSLVSALERIYLKLTYTPRSPALDFANFRCVSLYRKGLLALLWPVYRLLLEVDIAVHGIGGDSILLLAQK